MKKIGEKFIMIFLLCVIIIGCTSSAPNLEDFFMKSDRIDYQKYEYIGDVVVHKEGFFLFWIFRFGSGSENTAKKIMYKKVKKEFPEATGLLEVQIVEQEGVAIFDWTPSIVMYGKIVKNRN